MDYFISANTDVGIKKDTNQDGLSVKIIKTRFQRIFSMEACVFYNIDSYLSEQLGQYLANRAGVGFAFA